ELVGGKDVLFQAELAHRLAGGDGLAGDGGGGGVADALVERGDHGQALLHQGLAALHIGGDALDAALGEEARGVGQDVDRLYDVVCDDRDHHVELEVPGGAAPRHGGVVAD